MGHGSKSQDYQTRRIRRIKTYGQPRDNETTPICDIQESIIVDFDLGRPRTALGMK